jgi:hypothetical protein
MPASPDLPTPHKGGVVTPDGEQNKNKVSEASTQSCLDKTEAEEDRANRIDYKSLEGKITKDLSEL